MEESTVSSQNTRERRRNAIQTFLKQKKKDPQWGGDGDFTTLGGGVRGRNDTYDEKSYDEEPPAPVITPMSSAVVDYNSSGTSNSLTNSIVRFDPFKPSRQTYSVTQPPPAYQAAFSGPPRYDWIDIETSAVIKMQAAFRRHKVMNDLSRLGATTAAIRNRSRRRAINQSLAQTNDLISLFRCCGVDLGLDNTTMDYYMATDEIKKIRYEKQKIEREKREERLRKNFRRTKPINVLVESYEVIQ